RKHLLDIRGYRASLFSHPRDRLLDANRIPGLKDAQLVRESPLQRIVDFDNRIGDLRNTVGRINETLRHRSPQIFPGAVFGIYEEAQPIVETVQALRGVQGSKFGFLPRAVLQCREIERKYVLTDLLEEAALGLF